MLNTTLGIEEMLNTYSEVPDFLKYGDANGLSSRLLSIWGNEQKCGGPLTRSFLTSDTAEKIRVPDMKLLIKANE